MYSSVLSVGIDAISTLRPVDVLASGMPFFRERIAKHVLDEALEFARLLGIGVGDKNPDNTLVPGIQNVLELHLMPPAVDVSALLALGLTAANLQIASVDAPYVHPYNLFFRNIARRLKLGENPVKIFAEELGWGMLNERRYEEWVDTVNSSLYAMNSLSPNPFFLRLCLEHIRGDFGYRRYLRELLNTYPTLRLLVEPNAKYIQNFSDWVEAVRQASEDFGEGRIGLSLDPGHLLQVFGASPSSVLRFTERLLEDRDAGMVCLMEVSGARIDPNGAVQTHLLPTREEGNQINWFDIMSYYAKAHREGRLPSTGPRLVYEVPPNKWGSFKREAREITERFAKPFIN